MDAKPVVKSKRTIASNSKAIRKGKSSAKAKRNIASVDKSLSKKAANKRYWSVQCRQGFIKDSYVYCARSTASVAPAKKPKMKRMAAKTTGVQK